MGILSIFSKKSVDVIRDNTGEYSYWFTDNAFGNNKEYLKWSLTNPVLMTVIAIRSKLYSQMEIMHLDSSGNPIENSEVLKKFKNPNYFQSQQDFLFQQMWFLSATGENYTYSPKRFKADEVPSVMYNLIPSQLDFGNVQNLDSFIVQEKDKKKFREQKIKYTLNDTEKNIELNDLIPFYDLANNIEPNSWMSSPSRIDGIKDVLCNIEENLKSKNINLKMSQKYLASNKSGIDGTPMIGEEDREAIERTFGSKAFHITNANVDVKHLVSDLKRLYLDESFNRDAMKVLLAYEMNKDVLNYSSDDGSTYENQEQGTIRYIQNGVQSSADASMNSFADSFGLIEKGESLKASFNHLPVMQVVMKTRMETLKAYQETISIGLENGTITTVEAKKMSDKLIIDLGL